MLEFILKIIELFLTHHKNKFKKIEAVLERRQNFIDEVKKIEQNEDLTDDEKRALKNACAQLVCGSRAVNYELVDYYFRNKNFRNFEIIAPTIAFWEDAVSKEYDENGKIKSIKINAEKYKNERKNMLGTYIFTLLFIGWFCFSYNTFAHLLIKFLHVNLIASDYILVTIFFILLFFSFWALYGVLSVYDLKRFTEEAS